ncbi:MAG TPA: sensor histidine kinase [Thermoanaerobaculia bacterium]|nr:sensor histidine kinase [Thermoanaerobaculia bacterium]
MLRSFRGRLFLAALLWTTGLLFFAHLTFYLLARHYPVVLRLRFHSFIVFAIVCMIAGFVFLRRGLSRFAALRDALAAVRQGFTKRIEGDYPSEVEPLVTELNDLLDHRDEAVRRAQTKAADLAHGLKTPLAVIAHECDRLGEEPAAAIRQQLDRMQRQIDFHLAHARAAGSAATLGARTVLAEAVDALARTLQRLHASRGLQIDARIPPAHAVRVQREDLDEMLGNLLDNACKWARSRVAVASMIVGDRIVITVDDDGPGLDPALREAVLHRGVRADEAAPGSGLGLAIVRDLAEVYGGSIALESSNMGGVSARLELPQAK